MTVGKRDLRMIKKAVLFFLFLAAAILAVSYSLYRSHQKKIIGEKHAELTAIADLKIQQITQWQKERLGDAEIIINDAFISSRVKSYLQSPNSSVQKYEIKSWLNSFLKYYEYSAAYIFDTSGNAYISSSASPVIIRAHVEGLVREAAVRKKAVLSDFHRCDSLSDVRIFLITPIMTNINRNDKAIGVLLLCIDPEKLLFPIIEIWPTASRTSESLLIERCGNEIVFLNNLRHRDNTASVLRLPASSQKLPAVMAVRGIEGIVERKDYRGIEVLAVTRKVPDSPWYMVSKVDQEEVYAPILNQLWLISGAAFLLILASGIFFFIWWRNRKRQLKIERMAFLKHFEYLIKYAHDIYILVNENLDIIEVNDQALETYGYTREEMLAMNARDLHIIPPEVLPEKIKAGFKEDGVTFESIHRRKDGSTFPVELSVRIIEIEGRKFHQGIIRDITERKEAGEILKESEEKFRTLADKSPNMILIVYNGRVVYVNEKCEEMTGFSKEEFYSSEFNFLNSIVPEHAEFIIEKYRRHMSGEEIPPYEITVLAKDGRRIDTINTTKLIPYESGKAILSIMTDISERKKTEDMLQKFRLGIECSPDAVFITDASGVIVFINPAFERLYGYSYEEAVGKTPRIFKSGKITKEEYEGFWKALLSKQVMSGEVINKSKSGELVYAEGTINPILSNDGSLIGHLVIHRDIKDRKQKEEKIQQSFSLLQATLESTADGILVVDHQGNITNYNAQFVRMWNIPESIMEKGKDREVINFVLSQLKSPEDFVKNVEALYSNPEVESFDVLEFIDGRIFERYSRTQRIEGRPVGRVWSFRDITERRLAEQQLQESEERYRRLVEYLPDAIAVHCEGKIVFANPAGLKLIGATDESQLIGLPVMSMIHPDYVETVKQRILTGLKERKALPPMEEKFIRLDGTVIDVETTSIPTFFKGKPAIQVVMRDITEQKKLQYQFFQSQKIQSIGTLAGGIAHDFNNILAIILGYASTLEKNLDDSQKNTEAIAAINQAVDRGAALVRQILTFARKTDAVFKPVDVPDLIHELLAMLKETFSKTITFTLTYAPDIPDIIADRTQLHQTLLNLCVNARDAMPNGGSITIKAEQWKKEDMHKRFPTASDEMYVCISVTDTGVGMDEATYTRVFDPFFTTKEKGKGTGLGLSVVYGVMQSHHGFVDVESRLGEGTTFYLFFPVCNAADIPVDEIPEDFKELKGGTETVLIVEDEY
ncbi:MAG: PAS domain S-box protein, partial [Bacteroidetes bacterium]|nr:PAS domain S-box protein [Bacteroidota bacterium]